MLRKNFVKPSALLLLFISGALLTGCDFFGLKSATGVNYQPITPQRNNAITLDNNGNAIATWFVDGTLYARRYDASNGWTPAQTLAGDIDGEVAVLDVAMTTERATVVWEETPGSGATRNSYAVNYANGAWNTAPLAINSGTPGADPAVAANTFSAQPYLAAIAWSEITGGRNTTSGVAFQTLVPYYREQRVTSNNLSNGTRLGEIPEQAWLANNFDIGVDGNSNTVTVWTRRFRLPDNTEVHGILSAYKPLDSGATQERLIGFGNVITNVQLLVDQTGNATAFWLDDGRLFSNRLNISAGNWRDADEARQVGTQTTITDYAVATNAAGRMAVAWVSDNATVHAAMLFPNGSLSAQIAVNAGNIANVGIGIADNNNIRLAVQRNGQLYSANYVDSITTWSALSYVTATGSGSMSFAMDGSETAVAIWDLDEGNDIGRQVWVPGAPIASFSVTPNPANTNQALTFDASSSSAQGSIVSYEWDFDNDDSVDSTSGPVVTHSYLNSGTVTARLRVVDDASRFGEALQTITVNDPGAPNQFTLTVSADTNGTVTSEPAGIDCGGDCSEMYDADTNVRLTATPVSGFAFDRWGGDCLGDPGFNITTVVMNADKTCSAGYLTNSSNSLAVSVTGGGTVTDTNGAINCGTDCFENYSGPGTSVELFATPTTGWLFDQWSGSCFAFASNPIHAFATVTGDITCDASFVTPSNPVMLTLNINTDQGRVFEHYAGLDCNHPGGATTTTCTATYNSGMDIVLQVESASRADWFEGCDSLVMVDPANGVINCALQINTDTTATVVFR